MAPKKRPAARTRIPRSARGLSRAWNVPKFGRKGRKGQAIRFLSKAFPKQRGQLMIDKRDIHEGSTARTDCIARSGPLNQSLVTCEMQSFLCKSTNPQRFSTGCLQMQAVGVPMESGDLGAPLARSSKKTKSESLKFLPSRALWHPYVENGHVFGATPGWFQRVLFLAFVDCPRCSCLVDSMSYSPRDQRVVVLFCV